MMDEAAYLAIVDATYRRLLDLFEDVDGDDADLEPKGDVITIRFRDGRRAVVNTQRPVRQLWLAGGAEAWHFAYDTGSARWLDDKGSGAELFDTLRRVAAASGVVLPA